jgi:phage gp16-like protein
MAAVRKPVAADRRGMLAKIHLGAKELGLGDDARRDVLERLTGHRSSADCTDAQLHQVLEHFRSLGWKPKLASSTPRTGTAPISARKSAPADSAVAKKARAMWLSLFNLGVVRSSSEASLEAFGKRQLRVDRLQWADQSQGYRLIEALKAMAERAGWTQDLTMVKPERHLWALKARLVQRQRELLGELPLQISGMDEAALDRVAKEQGVLLRATLAVRGEQ